MNCEGYIFCEGSSFFEISSTSDRQLWRPFSCGGTISNCKSKDIPPSHTNPVSFFIPLGYSLISSRSASLSSDIEGLFDQFLDLTRARLMVYKKTAGNVVKYFVNS